MRRLIFCLLLGGIMLASPEAGAQQRPTPEIKGKVPPVPGSPAPANPPGKEPPETAEPAPPPYEPQILKLAEIMGSLAFLFELCGPPAGIAQADIWRLKAQQFLNAEPMSESRRQRFIGTYNRGFQGYRLVYRNCTANARLSMDRLMGDGAKLTRELASRFGS